MKKLFTLLFTISLLSAGCMSAEHLPHGSTAVKPSNNLLVPTSSPLLEYDEMFLNSNANLYVNDKLIQTNKTVNINYESQFAIIPVIEVMKALGSEIIDQNDTTVHFELRGRNYILDMSANSLTQNGSDWNYIAFPPGSTNGYYKHYNRELYIDSDTFRYFIREIGGEFSINFNESNVYITLQ